LQKDRRQDWVPEALLSTGCEDNVGRANNCCCLDSSPGPVYLRLADERTFPRRGLPALTPRARSHHSLPPATPDWRRWWFFTVIAEVKASL